MMELAKIYEKINLLPTRKHEIRHLICFSGVYRRKKTRGISIDVTLLTRTLNSLTGSSRETASDIWVNRFCNLFVAGIPNRCQVLTFEL